MRYRWVKDGALGAGRMRYGADYNPEQWPREVWRDDMRLMQEAGVNIVSLGIFSWALLEPRPGEWDFGWLDEVIDLLHESGIDVDLATATASPPPWLSRLHPEVLPVTDDGTVLHAGRAPALAPDIPDLPLLRPASRAQDRRALRGPSGARRLAHLQRARLPQRVRLLG